LRAKADGLKAAEAKIDVAAVPQPPSVPRAAPTFVLRGWRMSPVTATAPDPNQAIAENDQNSWSPVPGGRLQTFAGGKFAIFRVQFQPRANVRRAGGNLVFPSITGKAEVWLDGKLLGKKEDDAAAPLSVLLPAGEGERTLSVLIEAK